MAEIDSSAGIKRRNEWWGSIYTGGKDALLQAGLLPPDLIPGDTAPQKQLASRKYPDGSRIDVRKQKNGFRIDCTLPTEEWEVRRDADFARVNMERTRKELRQELDKWPRSGEAYRAEALRDAATFLALTRGVVRAAGRGYRFESDTESAFEQACDAALDCLRTGRITFDSADRQARERKLRQDLFGSGEEFDSFMRVAQSGGEDKTQ